MPTVGTCFPVILFSWHKYGYKRKFPIGGALGVFLELDAKPAHLEPLLAL